jgi:hypothetical protein
MYGRMSQQKNARSMKPIPLVLYIIIAILILIILWLPPIAILDRLQTIGLQSVDANGGTITVSDGTRLTIPPGGKNRATWLDLSAHPDEISVGAAPLPAGVSLVGEVYQIEQYGDNPGMSVLDVAYSGWCSPPPGGPLLMA